MTNHNLQSHKNDIDIDNEFNKIKIRRDGEHALTFTGRVIAQVDSRRNDGFVWTEITIYRTKGNKIVVEIEDVSQWQGAHNMVRAESFCLVHDAINYLRDEDGELSSISQSAIEEAGTVDREFELSFVEHVD